MVSRWCVCLLILSFCTAFAAEKSRPAAAAHDTASRKLPVTTSSTRARKSFEKAMVDFEQYRYPEMLQDLRAATKADPNFAQAFVLIARLSGDPTEQAETRDRAKQSAHRVSPGERLLIRWIAGAQENDYLSAIAAMNDLLGQYPRDQRLLFLAGDWLIEQQRYKQAEGVLERAVSLFPDYAAALNDLGYAYVFTGNFDKAFAAMDRYVALEPDQPNPHDSYGEILRMAGKFDAALEQYRMSIRIDANFGSELGVADTYALMGKEEDARAEYERAIVFAKSDSDKVQYELQSALTWIREDNRKQAEKALNAVAKHAHAADLARWEADAHRILAMYELDSKAAMKQLQQAQSVLKEPHGLSKSDLLNEQARILRVRAAWLAEVQDFESATSTLQQLEAMAQNSRSQVVQLCYHGAAGAVLSAQKDYAAAISHLEEDSSDPISMKLLQQAYERTGATSQAQVVTAKLAALNLPTAEQALVVPRFRAGVVSQTRQP